MKPVNSLEHNRRSSRSGSLINTPDHQPMQSNVPVGKLCSFDDSSGETSNYLEANDSSATSSCSFDALPDAPPVPPRITNPPSRNNRTAASEHLIIIDTDEHVDAVPIPAIRTKAPKTQMVMTTINNTTTVATTAKPPIFGFENSFVSNINSLNLLKNNNGMNGLRPQPHIDPPPKHLNHKLNMIKTETVTSEVRRIPSKMFVNILLYQFEMVPFEMIMDVGRRDTI